MYLGRVQSLVAKRVRTCVRRRRVSHIRGSGEHRAFGAPMNENCTLWTLRVAWWKAFSLLRFFVAKDQEMTWPRTVANSDKEKIRLSQTTKAESTNPAPTPTANPRTWQPDTPPPPIVETHPIH